MEFGILGPLQVRSGSGEIPLSSVSQRVLLAMLLVHPGPVAAERLIAALWPHAREPADDLLRSHIQRLRERLGEPGRIVATPSGYAIELAGGELDAAVFARLAAQGRSEQALRLWRGEALCGLDHVPDLKAAAAGLEERRLTVLEARIDADLAAGRRPDLIAELRALVAGHPHREGLHARLMLALHHAGRHAEALAAYADARRRLAAELGAEPGPRLRDLERAVLAHELAGSGWHGPRSHLTVLIGRRGERDAVADLVRRRRLVTVVGVGGAGKSALAMKVAEDIAATPRAHPGSRDAAEVAGVPHEVAVVELGGVRGADEVVLAAGAVLGVTGTSAGEVRGEIERRLAGRRLLLLLDGCEHVADGCAGLARRLVAACPGVRVLATSRRPLAVPDEVVWTLDGLAEEEAAELFRWRAQEASPGVALGEAEVTRICARLDGLPLALELAAARLRTLTPEELARQLLGGGTASAVGRGVVDAVIGWSRRMLRPDEQRLLARLSVFRDGFTGRAAEAVCSAPPLDRGRVSRALAVLVDLTLVRRDQGRYRLVTPMREVAAAWPAGFGEAGAVADRHLDHWLAELRAAGAAPSLWRVAMAGLPLGAETAGLRAALEHGFGHGREVEAAELVAMAFVHWVVARTHHTEGGRWLAAALPHLPGCPPGPAQALRLAAAFLLADRGDWPSARDQLLPITADLDTLDPRLRPEALSLLTFSELHTLNPAALTTSAHFFARYGDFADVDAGVLALATRAHVLTTWGRHAEAADLCDRFARHVDAAGPSHAARLHAVRAQAAHTLGDHDTARDHLARANRHFADPGSCVHHGVLHRALVAGALATGDLRPAADRAICSLTSLYPPSLTGAAEFKVLLGEAGRRAGALEEARASLAEGLAEGAPDYAGTLPGVLSTALLAADLGEHAVARALAAGWDRVRRGAGLPVPPGFSTEGLELPREGAERPEPGQAATGTAPPGAGEWRLEPIRELVERAAAWCRGQGC